MGTPAVDVGANSGASGADMMLVVMYPWPVYGGPLGLAYIMETLPRRLRSTRLGVKTAVHQTTAGFMYF